MENDTPNLCGNYSQHIQSAAEVMAGLDRAAKLPRCSFIRTEDEVRNRPSLFLHTNTPNRLLLFSTFKSCPPRRLRYSGRPPECQPKICVPYIGPIPYCGLAHFKE